MYQCKHLMIIDSHCLKKGRGSVMDTTSCIIAALPVGCMIGWAIYGYCSGKEVSSTEPGDDFIRQMRERNQVLEKAKQEAFAKKKASMEVLPWSNKFTCSKCTFKSSWDWKKAPPELCKCALLDEERFHSHCQCKHEIIVRTADRSPKSDAKIIPIKGGNQGR